MVIWACWPNTFIIHVTFVRHNRKKNISKAVLEMRMKYCVFLSAFLGLVSCTRNRSGQRLTTSLCPENWITIGTGCYLFAIPEILEIDDSCKIDGIPSKCFYTMILVLNINLIIISNVSTLINIYEHFRLPSTRSCWLLCKATWFLSRISVIRWVWNG